MSDRSVKIELKRSIPRSFWVFLIGTVILILVGFGGTYSAFIIAWAALLAAVLRWPFHEKGEAFELTDEGLVRESDSQLLSWDSLERVTIGGQCVDPKLLKVEQKGVVSAHFGAKIIKLKSTDEMGGGQLYSQLWDIVLANPPVELKNANTLEHYSKQVEKYGEQDVIASSGGTASNVKAGNIKVEGKMLLGLLGIVIASIIGAVVFSDDSFAIVLSATCTILLIALSIAALSSKPKKDGSELVMSPDGLMLVSKGLKGVLKWREVKAVSLIPVKAKPLQLKINVEGADIILSDNFQHPVWYLKRKTSELPRKQKQADVFNAEQVEPAPNTDPNPYRPPRMD